jgi:hypothetical protein
MTIVSDVSVVTSLFRVRLKVPELPVILKDPEFTPPEKSAAAVVPELVQYKVVPSATLVVVMVHVTVDPSFAEAALGLTLYVAAASFTVTVLAVATIAPLVLSVLSSKTIVSDPSYNGLLSKVRVTLAVFVLIVIDPLFKESEKSSVLVVPLVVQYNTVPSDTLVVVIVNVIELLSVIVVVLGTTA